MSHIQEYDDETDDFISILTKQISHLHTNINNKIQKNVMELIGEDLYDYSNIKTYDIDDIINYYKKNSYNNFYINIGNIIQYNKNNILKECGEKIIIYFNEDLIHNITNISHFPSCTIVTNYGTLFHIKYGYYVTNFGDPIIKRYEYWIPKDYINILQILSYKRKTNTIKLCDKNNTFTILQSFLEHIKENLYNGLYVKNNVDIHFMDVYKEKQRFLINKEIFETYKNAKEIELEIENRKLKEERKLFEIKKLQLQNISRKLKIEQLNINKQKEVIDYFLLNKTSTDELFNIFEKDGYENIINEDNEDNDNEGNEDNDNEDNEDNDNEDNEDNDNEGNEDSDNEYNENNKDNNEISIKENIDDYYLLNDYINEVNDNIDINNDLFDNSYDKV